MNLEGVIQASLFLKPYLELDVAASASSRSASATLYRGYDVWVQGMLGVKLAGHRIGPSKALGKKQLLSDKTKVWTGNV